MKWEAATQYNVGLDYTLFGNTLYGTMISVAEVDEKEYRELKEKITELETKLYTVRKELKNCYENCFGTVGDHADTGA